MMTQNLWDAAKAVLRGKFIAIQSRNKETRKIQETKTVKKHKHMESKSVVTELSSLAHNSAQ